MADGDPFDLDSAMDLDPDPAPRRPYPARFHPKLKGKVKAETSSNQEPAESTPSTALAISTPTPIEEDDPEGDDPVVREIDVFCTHLEEDAQLYVMQYPLRPSWRPYELDERCEEVKVKPNNSEVELVLRMDVESENYDIDAPEPKRLRKQILLSSTATSMVQCAAGSLIKNQLHLNPIHGVLQFRPSINHINNDCGVQIKQHKTQEVDKKSDKGKLVIRDSSDHIDDEVPWVSLEYNPIGSTYSCKYQHKLMACLHDNIKFTMNPSEYVDSLCPGTSTIKMKAKVPSSSFLPSFPLEERLKEWFQKFSQNVSSGL